MYLNSYRLLKNIFRHVTQLTIHRISYTTMTLIHFVVLFENYISHKPTLARLDKSKPAVSSGYAMCSGGHNAN